ncbi:hypothetical protein GIR22_25185 [Pseudomonas sp. CCM 7891]|uniref:Uncharacterized protein n=1 Tax=Pseudomonas karstica TaxID=1055468 RepID=A0A7X2RWI0_9PSED|nr:hypothetical protein [Pseudomonas karstica]MTD22427.1 hypothetical protein [Pseudomonas karstica]
MTMFKNLMLALTMLGASAAVQACDGSPIIQDSNRIKKSGSVSAGLDHVSFNDGDGHGSTWGQSLGRTTQLSPYYVGYEPISGRFNGTKLRQQDLQGRYDVPQPER